VIETVAPRQAPIDTLTAKALLPSDIRSWSSMPTVALAFMRPVRFGTFGALNAT
jgi:hypothetical protein